MIAVIFEVWPADGRKDDYLDAAARLKQTLETMDGFISVERFQSLTDPSAVDLTFASVLPRVPPSECQIQNRTRILYFLVSLWF